MAGCRAPAPSRSWRASIIWGRWRARARDLALAYDAMQGHDPEDPVCAERAGRAGAGRARARHRRPAHRRRRRLLRARRRARGAAPRWRASPRRWAPTREVEIPEAARARAAAYIITASEGAALHLDRLRTRPRDFDPAVRDRLIAGAMVPGALVVQGAEIPPLVSRAGAEAVRERRRDPGAGHALPRAAHRPADHACSTAWRCRCGPTSASSRSRSRSSACRWWRCRCRSRRCRSACRSSPRPGARTWRCASRTRSENRRRGARRRGRAE